MGLSRKTKHNTGMRVISRKMENQKPTRGGRRPGSGRKPRAVPLVAVTVRLEAGTVEKFRTMCRNRGHSQSGQLAEWIEREHVKPCEINIYQK